MPRFEDAIMREATENGETYQFPTGVRKEIRENIMKEQAEYTTRGDAKRYKGVNYR